MSYTPTNWTTGDTITATKLNKMEQGIAEGGGYDLVIASNSRTVDTGVQNMELWSVIEGSIAACEEKLENGQPINAMAIVWLEEWSVPAPNDMKYFLPLIHFHAPYRLLYFGGIYNDRRATNSTTAANPIYVYASFAYDVDTKALTHGHYDVKYLTVSS